MRITAKRAKRCARRRKIAEGALVGISRADGVSFMCRITEGDGADYLHVVISAEEVAKFAALKALWSELDKLGGSQSLPFEPVCQRGAR